MITTNFLVPPPELVGKWLCSDNYPWGPLEQTSITITTNRLQNVATQAAQWGADRELEACCECLRQEGAWPWPEEVARLRAARRPKPPSRKEQALEAIGRLCASVIHDDLKNDAATIRRALEALDD